MKSRNRGKYFLYIIITISFGMASRKYGMHLPEIVAVFTGDILWAVMIYFIIGFIFRIMHPFKVAIFALLFCFLIELSQLYQASWIINIRKTTIGALLLGQGFLWSDLICYSLGIMLGYLLEVYLLRNNKRIF
ncbi:MAG: DUF2809 domain-containing protein [Bacteroidota bacterium]|nr:DUF2809 domain-containing protein [Bacteroidota bacterium]